MIADEADAREGAFAILRTECPAGGPHEVISGYQTPAELSGTVDTTARYCRKCGLRDTYIQEAP